MKNTPLRMCVVCKEMRDKRSLMRVAKDSQGNVFVDSTQKADGRGAYICGSGQCIDKAIKTKALNRSLSTNVPSNIYEQLREGKVDK